MTPFSNAHRKRRIASTLLAFWLFALGAAWANACVLQERGTHAHTAEAVAAGAPTVLPGHIGIVVDHIADSAPVQGPCLKVCDDSSRSLVRWQSDIQLVDSAMLVSTAWPWSAWVVGLNLSGPARIERSAQSDPPLRTLYSRLTL